MRVTTKPTQEKLHLLMHHGVADDELVKVLPFVELGQIPFQQKITGIKIIALRGQLFNGVASVKQFPFVTVNVGDGRLTRCS